MAWFPWGGADVPLAQLKPYVPSHLWHLARLGWNGTHHIVPWLREQRVDLCLAAWAVPSGYFAYHAKKILGIPYGVWALGSDIYKLARYPGLRLIIQRVLRQADGLFADGLDLGQRVQALAGRPCHFLPSARPFLDDVPADNVQMDTAQTNFLFIGRWEKIKGIDVLIEAMHLLRQAHVSAHLYVVGKGSLKGWLEQKIHAYALGDTVFLREDVPTTTLRGYLQQCDCLVIPSRSDSIPLVFSEGVQASKPMIVSATGDLPALVQRFHLGVVVTPGDPVQLQHALTHFIAQRACPSTPRPAFEAAHALFDLQQAAAEFIHRAEDMVQQSSTRPGQYV
jgi:glycosyltransferase involved in cell wall biosynthesis